MSDAVLRVQSRLTDRDHILLGWLYDHGVLTSFQIAHALFPSVDVTQKRLRKLTGDGVIARFRPQKPDGGSYPYHYVLDQLGTDVVAMQRGDELPRRDQAKRRRWHLTNRANLPHLLGTNQFFTDLAGYARTHPDTALERWWPAARCQQPGAFLDPGDDNIQVRAYPPRVRPDGHGIWTEHHPDEHHAGETVGEHGRGGGRRTVPFFAEFDNNTMPLGKLVDKIDGYVALARAYNRVWPVLFSLHSAARERHLHRELTDAEIWYPVATTTRDTTTDGADGTVEPGRSPAEAVWWLHRHEGGLLRLIDLASTIIDGHRDVDGGGNGDGA
jgi:Replication-relaxation